jgi:hypothetical protein
VTPDDRLDLPLVALPRQHRRWLRCRRQRSRARRQSPTMIFHAP